MTKACVAVLLLSVSWSWGSVPLPEILFVGEGTVWRRSDTKNERGLPTPPFKDALVGVIGFTVEPQIGEKVTVIPDNGVAAFDLRVVDTQLRELPEGKAWWEVELEPVEAGPLLTAPPRTDRHPEYPIGVIAVYPAIENARGMSPVALDPGALPPEVPLEMVHMAADLDGYGSADVLVVKFCCKNSAKDARNGCTDYDDYVCTDTFLKEAGVWKKIREGRPL